MHVTNSHWLYYTILYCTVYCILYYTVCIIHSIEYVKMKESYLHSLELNCPWIFFINYSLFGRSLWTIEQNAVLTSSIWKHFCGCDINQKDKTISGKTFVDQNKRYSFLILQHLSHSLKSFWRNWRYWGGKEKSTRDQISQKPLGCLRQYCLFNHLHFLPSFYSTSHRHLWIICKHWILILGRKGWAKECAIWPKRAEHLSIF